MNFYSSLKLFIVLILSIVLLFSVNAVVSHSANQVILSNGATLENVLGNFPAGAIICSSANAGVPSSPCFDDSGPWAGDTNIFYTGGKVGIGTITPTATLTVDQQANHGWDAGLRLTDSGGNYWDIVEGSGQELYFGFKGTTIMVLKNGNVGIGTGSPADTLDVSRNWWDNSPTDWGGGIKLRGTAPTISFWDTDNPARNFMIHANAESLNFYQRPIGGGFARMAYFDSANVLNTNNIKVVNHYFDANDDAWLRIRDADGGNYKDVAVGKLYAATDIYDIGLLNAGCTNPTTSKVYVNGQGILVCGTDQAGGGGITCGDCNSNFLDQGGDTATGQIGISINSAEGGSLRLQNPGKNTDWILYNMRGVYGESFQIWNYPGGTPNPRFKIEDDGDTQLVPGGGTVGIGIGPSGAAKIRVFGDNMAGVYTAAHNGWGVYAESDTQDAIRASTQTAYGVRGISTNSAGVGASGGAADFWAYGPGQDYGSASSIRWKNNIQPINKALDKVISLRGVYFNWDKEHGGQHDLGMIAEEVGKIVPEVVLYEDDGVYAKGMDYSKLTPILVEAIKEQQDQIEQLQSELCKKDSSYKFCSQ